MDNRVVGGILLLAGAGALGYVYLRRGQLGPSGLGKDITATLQPSPPMPSGRHDQVVTLKWVPTATGSVVVQGVTVQGGLVTGHWFATLGIARQAVARYDAGDTQGAAQMAATDVNRRVTVPSGTNTVNLYEVLDAQPGQEWWFWLRSPGQAMIADPLDMRADKLPIPDFTVRVS